MNITILCSSNRHPVNSYLRRWITENISRHEIKLIRSAAELTSGEILFLISCNEIIRSLLRSRYAKSLVIHASDLPDGRGMSPHIWQVIDGATSITLTLFEAEDGLDSGDVWHKVKVEVPGDLLWNEINHVIFTAELKLMDFAVAHFYDVKPYSQTGIVKVRRYRKRVPEDSRVDPTRSILDQFDLIRVCDPDRYPAFFNFRGHRYKLTLEKADE